MATPMAIEKIDMSLDDIIKLNRSNRGRGRGSRGGNRGSNRGKPNRGQGSSRGQNQGMRGKQAGAWGNAQSPGKKIKGRGPNKFKQLRMNPGGAGRGRGQRMGRGGILSSRRGNQKGVSPLNRGGSTPRNMRGRNTRGQGRGAQSQMRGIRRGSQNRVRGMGRGTQIERNQQNTGRGAAQNVQHRPNLQQRRSQALKALQQAKATLAKINAQTRSSQNRQNLVNQRRGIEVPTSTNTFQGNKRRRWRNPQNQTILTVQVDNSQVQPQKKNKKIKRRNSLRDEILSLKPVNQEKFNVQKIYFAQKNTGVPLSQRFSSGSSGSSGERKVFF